MHFGVIKRSINYQCLMTMQEVTVFLKSWLIDAGSKGFTAKGNIWRIYVARHFSRRSNMSLMLNEARFSDNVLIEGE